MIYYQHYSLIEPWFKESY